MPDEIIIKLDETEFAAIWKGLQHCYRRLPASVRKKFRLGEYAPKLNKEPGKELLN